jgi:hypothetical protein
LAKVPKPADFFCMKRAMVWRRLAPLVVRRFEVVRRIAAVRCLAVLRRFAVVRRFTGVRFFRDEREVAARFLRFAISCLKFRPPGLKDNIIPEGGTMSRHNRGVVSLARLSLPG